MKQLFTLLATIVAFTSCTTKSGFVIEGNLAGAEGTIYLSTLEGKMPKIIDSTQIIDGLFTFEGNLAFPAFSSISTEQAGTVCYFFLEDNDQLQIVGDISERKSIKVIGGGAEDLYQNSYLPIRGELDKAEQFVIENNDNIVAAYVLFRELSYQLPVALLDSLSGQMSAQMQQSSYIKVLNERIVAMKRSEVGQKYIDIALPDTSGNVVKLSSLVEGGNYVFLDFWASWCPPCRAENPNVVKAFEQFSNRGFTVYGVSLDRENGADAWKKAINDDKLFWTNVSDLKFWDCEPAKMYGVNAIPSNFLISPDGVIIGKNLHGEQLITLLETTLNGETVK